MAFNPLDWFRSDADGVLPEPRKQFLAGLIVWVLAWLVVWWIQDQQTAWSSNLTARQQAVQKVFTEHSSDPAQTPTKVREVLGVESTKSSAVAWLGTILAMGLFWGGGLLVFRPLTSWGFCLRWLRRCETIERLALVGAAALTLAAIVLHWFWNHIDAWMLAAAVALLILASAFGWRFPGKKTS